MNLNKVTIAGRLTRDPETKHTPKGTSVCRFSVAINRRWKSESGEAKEEITFLDCEAWGSTAEAIAKWLKKGSEVYAEGRLRVDNWEKDGVKKSKTIIAVESWQFCGGKRDEAPRAAEPTKPAAVAANENQPEGDDVPF